MKVSTVITSNHRALYQPPSASSSSGWSSVLDPVSGAYCDGRDRSSSAQLAEGRWPRSMPACRTRPPFALSQPPHIDAPQFCVCPPISPASFTKRLLSLFWIGKLNIGSLPPARRKSPNGISVYVLIFDFSPFNFDPCI